jgi:glycosyltransferase involved in cell wall biosynthesis
MTMLRGGRDRRREPAPTGGITLLVDARVIDASGLGRYLRELLAHWFAATAFERFELLGDPEVLTAFVRAAAPAAPVRIVPYRGAVYSPRSQMDWLSLQARGELSGTVAFFPHWDAPLALLPRASVVTVHDLIHFRVPDAFPAARRALARPTLRHVVRRAARVVCPSEATARDLGAWMPSASRKVCAVPNGVSARFFAPCESPLGGPYLLCVGNGKPHKNVAAAVDVLARLRTEFPSLRLVVVGQRGSAAAETAARARGVGVGDAVVDLGTVDDETLHRCYAGAVALLFPSRYEGFGLPVVEAMAAGAAVVASRTPAVAEVVGDAAPLRDPDDVEGMADDVRRLLTDARWRAAVVAAGRERAARFSWERAAAETADILRAAASPRSAARRARVDPEACEAPIAAVSGPS